MNVMYGVIDSNNGHVDVSKTLRGAKCYATRHGYQQVSVRYNNGYAVRVVAVKNSFDKWEIV